MKGLFRWSRCRITFRPLGWVKTWLSGPYLSRLCDSLGHSMISDRRPIELDVQVSSHDVKSGRAVRLGLITTELVINAVKHAFPYRSTGHILVNYVGAGGSWGLSVSDDGVGLGTAERAPRWAGHRHR
jgi:two-component system, sensor histidine kinase PdtaS